MKKVLLIASALLMFVVSHAQWIYEPEGINMPGSWNASWTNPPSNLALASAGQVPGGRVARISTGTPRYQTIFSVASSGADLTGGSYQFKFSSGPSGNPWNNAWGDGNFSMNTLTNLNIGGATGNNNVTITNGKWYTVNYIDNNYSNTQAIFMETSAQPVTLDNVSQSPLNGSITSSDDVIVTVDASAAPSAEEKVYVRWTANGFASSSLALVTFVGDIGTATIPAQGEGVQVDYYVFSTTVNNPAVADADKVTIKFKNAGTGNFGYTVNTALPPVNITFQVDMSQQVVGGSVNIAGSFTSWNPIAMTNAGGGLYTYTASLNQGASIEYKYVNGSTYEGNLSAPCGNDNNRVFTVGTSDSTLSAVCFGLCTSCPPTCDVTFRVNMSAFANLGDVSINGNFPPAYWSNLQGMTPVGGGIYEYTVTLPQGASYEYKFINGSTYENNFGGPCGNGFNRTITVPATSSTTLPAVCFNSCNTCAYNDVTFQVNMSNEIISTGVYLMGDLPGSNWAVPLDMTNQGGGVYAVTLSLVQGASYTYKFMNGEGYEGDLGAPCGNGSNRTFTVPASASTVRPLVCYGSCNDCLSAVSVTFRLNMTNQVISPNGVHMAGQFQNAGYSDWDPADIELLDPDGNGIYEVTINNLVPGTVIQYKFVNGNAWGSDEAVIGACNVSGNRQLTVPNSSGALTAVCYGACSNCSYAVYNDTPYSAPMVSYSSNAAYPNCYPISVNTVGATDSPQSGVFNGVDVWYKFVAQSNAVSISLSSANADDAIALYARSGNFFTLVSDGSENAASGNSDSERLNISGLTVGQTYFVSVGTSSLAAGNSHNLCIQHLMPSWCAYSIPSGGFSLCNSYKAVYRGSPSQGVTYSFSFIGIGETFETGVVSPTNGLVSLSHPGLGLRYGGTYNVQVSVTYTLNNGAGIPEPIVVLGNTTSPNCSGVYIRNQPLVEVRSSQRCPANLLRSSWLVGAPVSGDPNPCSAVSYTFEFMQVVSCTDTTLVSAFPLEYTTVGNTPYLGLGVLPNLSGTGAWRVRIRPNFTYGNGVYGPAQWIQVANTSASAMLPGNDMIDDQERSSSFGTETAVYPNPGNGEVLNLNIVGFESDMIPVRVLDGMGRVVYTKTFYAEGSLNTTIDFAQPLSNGIYVVEMIVDGHIMNERMIVQH